MDLVICAAAHGSQPAPKTMHLRMRRAILYAAARDDRGRPVGSHLRQGARLLLREVESGATPQCQAAVPQCQAAIPQYQAAIPQCQAATPQYQAVASVKTGQLSRATMPRKIAGTPLSNTRGGYQWPQHFLCFVVPCYALPWTSRKTAARTAH